MPTKKVKLSKAMLLRLDKHSKSQTRKHMAVMSRRLRMGASFAEAHRVASKAKGNY